ncbi:MAG: endonuclease/exonuclease/phosphatase family protein [Pirellulaceae bacterium]
MHSRSLCLRSFLVFALLVACFRMVGAAEPIKVMSFNVRYGAANDGPNHWDKRKPLVAETIREFDPDLLGTQETLKFQADYISEQVDGYEYFGRSRMKSPNEHCGIFFRAERFTQLAGGHFWLSESPEVPESKSWDSSLPRMATWVLLSDRSNELGRPILFVNTHFDHRGKQARLRSAELLRRKLKTIATVAKDPTIVVTGDFNTGESTAPYDALVTKNEMLVDSFRVINSEKQSDEGTFNSWKGTTSGARIDWVLVDPKCNILSADAIRSNAEGRYPSDHFPVFATIAVGP